MQWEFPIKCLDGGFCHIGKKKEHCRVAELHNIDEVAFHEFLW